MTKSEIKPGRKISRRQLLKAGAGTAALLAAAKLNFPAGAFAQGAGPEVKGAKLGFIALTDAGKRVTDETIGRHVANEVQLLAVLSPPEQEKLSALLKKLIAGLQR